MTPRKSDYPMSPGQQQRQSGPSHTKLLGITCALLCAVVGFIATEATSARAEIARDIADHAQRISRLEEGNKHIQQSQARIEAVLEDIRRRLREERRR